MPTMNADKAQDVSDSFNSAQGVGGLKKLYGSTKDSIVQALKNRMGTKTDDDELAPQTTNGSGS